MRKLSDLRQGLLIEQPNRHGELKYMGLLDESEFSRKYSYYHPSLIANNPDTQNPLHQHEENLFLGSVQTDSEEIRIQGVTVWHEPATVSFYGYHEIMGAFSLNPVKFENDTDKYWGLREINVFPFEHAGINKIITRVEISSSLSPIERLEEAEDAKNNIISNLDQNAWTFFNITANNSSDPISKETCGITDIALSPEKYGRVEGNSIYLQMDADLEMTTWYAYDKNHQRTGFVFADKNQEQYLVNSGRFHHA